jgi:hypothetical protein
MKLKKKKPKIKHVMTTCSWCGLKIRSEGPIYALGCKKRPEVVISKYESKVMPVKIATLGKTFWSIVPPADSDARKDGKVIMFTLCSEECGDKLKETLELEKDLGELIHSAEHIY